MDEDEYNEGFDRGVLQGDHERQALKAEIARLKQHKQDLNAAITLMRTLAKEQLDEAREAAKHLAERHGIIRNDLNRWPWLEEK